MGKFELNKKQNKILSFRKRSVRIDYTIKNHLIPPSNIKIEKFYGKSHNNCTPREVHSLYLIEPRPSNKEIYHALQNAWHQTNPLNVSSEFFIDSSYLTNKK
jgi:hypothetical protein